MMTATTEVLGYIDKTIDNVIEIPATVWRSDEVVEMLRELRGMLTAATAVPAKQFDRDQIVAILADHDYNNGGGMRWHLSGKPTERALKVADRIVAEALVAVPATGDAHATPDIFEAMGLPPVQFPEVRS